MATNPTDQGGAPPLATRVKNILVTPKTEWQRIDAEPATIAGIYRSYVFILAAIPPLATLIGSLLFGYSAFGITYRPPVATAIAAAAISFALSLAAVYVMALIIEALAPTFGGTRDRVQAFKVAAYSSTPGWVAGILMIVPTLGMIAGLLGLYGLYLLYLGLPTLMKSPPEKSVGYIAAAIVAAILVYIVVGAVAGALLGAMAPAAGIGSISLTG